MAKRKDFLLKKIAIDEGYITPEKMQQLLSEQEALEQNGETISLGELIRQQEILDKAQLEALQKKVVLQMNLGATKALPPLMHLSKPQKMLGHYEILEELGHGSLGKIYKANDTRDNKKVVLKEISPQEDVNLAEIERFIKELERAKHLDHANIAKIYEVHRENEICFFTMEWIDGHSLQHLMKEKRLAISPSADIIRQAAMALHYAHERRVYHRNLTPANIFLDSFVEPMLTDFGLAKSLRSEAIGGVTLMGVPEYMSPEQASGIQKQVDAQSDIFTLGAILYEMIAGQPPFSGKTPREVLDAIQTQKPVAPSKINEDVPKTLENITLKALERSRDRRYQSALSFARDLDNFLQGKTVEISSSSSFDLVKLWLLLLGSVIIIIALALAIFSS